MARFRYKVADAAGGTSEGEIEAVSRAAAIERLRADDRLPIRVDEVGAADARGRGLSHRAAVLLARPLWGGDAPTSAEIADFTRELATLLGAGIALERALDLVGAAGAPRAGRLAGRLAARVRAGATLSAALEAEPASFGGFYRAMVRAGEAGGRLAPVLERIHGELARGEALREALRGALVYPAALAVVALLSVVVLLVFVMPQFETLFRQSGADLPWLTAAVLGLARGVRDWGWLGLGLAAAVAVALRAALREPATRLRAAAAALRLPLVGSLLRRLEVQRFAAAAAMLVGGGVALPTAVAIASGAVRNAALASALGRCEARLREGVAFGAALAEAGLPAKALELVRIGEETGRLEAMLVRIAEIYEREVAAGLRRLVAIVEPTLILALGAVVAGIILSLLSAMMGIYSLAV